MTSSRPDSSIGDDSGTGDACADGFVDLPPTPPGWGDAYYVLTAPGETGQVPTCPEGTNELGEIVELPVAVDACACECAPACWVNGHPDPACTMIDDVFEGATDGACAHPIDNVGPYHITIDDDLADDDDCAAPIATPVIEPETRRTCVHTSGIVCASVPTGALGPCVRGDGDLDCPSGPFSRKVYTATSISVACDTCGDCLEAARAACSTAEVSLFSDADCSGMEYPVSSPRCSEDAGMSLRVDLDLACPSADASLGPAVDDRTYCCVE